MKNAGSSGISLFLVALCALMLGLGGCSGDDVVPAAPPEVLFAQAKEAIADEDYNEAIEYLSLLRQEYPFSSYAVEAELLEADALFADEKYFAAAAAYGAFEQDHPFHERTHYALYRRGLSSYHMMDTADRDMTSVYDAIAILSRYLKMHPGKPEAQDAREKLDEAVNLAAAHELYVARFYARMDQYDAALARIRDMLKLYPDSSSRDEALRLALELETLKQEKEAEASQ